MKTVRVVAAVIKAVNESGETIIFETQRGYGDFKGGWEFPGGKIEAGETPQEALKREIMEELDTEISVGERIDTIEYDYPEFHLSMDCFWCEIVSGNLVLKEHEAAKWLNKESLYSVEWLPADASLIQKIGMNMMNHSKPNGLQLSFEIDDVMNYAMQQHGVEIVREVVLKNTTDKDIDNLLIRVTSDTNLVAPFEVGVEKVRAGGEVCLKNLKVRVNGDYLVTLTERITCLIKVAVYFENEVLISEEKEIVALAFDQWPGLKHC